MVHYIETMHRVDFVTSLIEAHTEVISLYFVPFTYLITGCVSSLLGFGFNRFLTLNVPSTLAFQTLDTCCYHH